MSGMVNKQPQRGYGSAERPVIGVLWERDAGGQNQAMTAKGTYEPSHKSVDLKRYYDPAVFSDEVEKIWRKQWLYACREEDIPQIGDRVPFHVGPLSFFIVRTAEDEFKAFYNACPHRGTMLCAKPESGATIRCPYHAWEWNVDGKLKRIPSHWDFPEVTRVNGGLPEVKLDRWGGFVFINADPESGPLEEALGVMPEHLRQFAPETRYTKARYRKLVQANWKITQEAFQEAYHLYATHPEGVPFNGDSQSQYDIWPTRNGAIGREAVPSAVPSMHAGPEATPLQAAHVFAQVMKSWHYPEADLPELDSAKDIRAQIGAWHRKVYEQTYGRPNHAPDAVMLDSVLYFMFPHFCIWFSEAVPFVYQFTPHSTDPGLCYFEVRLLMPCTEGEPRPPSSPAVEVGIGESIFEKVPAFGFLGMIFDQDMNNMPLVQRGAQAADPQQAIARLGTYQESLIQHWHELFDRLLSA
ncbi:Rieske 2Fe-2S domain-containing protein [Acidocella sp. KAb 2-4]|uniref:aromatic ring-hydroxylating oxygenase subunit alpha n=1 Tax=Acidocella sp. KAb 2-4 TaxID=2885158 RepID=UPI001D05D205|nr:aromatic ring-hydroxylating dioxygenase subunit alpha [Acidocella sp. KAb 2-4]MCB5946074.1 aromatic ring-hydroxylating dioxygenase subunit alpha [Acidocella sp. KAb 2-4]